MEKIIRKAIEGRYKEYTETSGSRTQKYHSDILLDPLFWQALGKACGWKNDEWVTCLYGCQVMMGGEGCSHNISPRDKPRIPFWQYHALRFHEINLTESFEKAVEYLENLIKH